MFTDALRRQFKTLNVLSFCFTLKCYKLISLMVLNHKCHECFFSIHLMQGGLLMQLYVKDHKQNTFRTISIFIPCHILLWTLHENSAHQNQTYLIFNLPQSQNIAFFLCCNISCNITVPNIPTVIVTPSCSWLRHRDCSTLELSLPDKGCYI